jgi:predicted DNA-binding antitoxin AbrB/MazE fold protein
MITVRAIYENGLLRPAHPLPLAEGETVEITVANASPASPEEWERKIRAANTIQEWADLANVCPQTDPDFDIVKAMNESRRLTGFRLPDPEPNQGEPA